MGQVNVTEQKTVVKKLGMYWTALKLHCCIPNIQTMWQSDTATNILQYYSVHIFIPYYLHLQKEKKKKLQNLPVLQILTFNS